SRPIEIINRTSQITLQPTWAGNLRFLKEGHSHGMRTRFQWRAKSQARFDGVSGVGRRLKQRFQIVLAADRRVVNTLSIDREFDFMRRFTAANDIQVRAVEPGLKLIFAVHRKVLTNVRSTDSSERHVFDVLILREVLANTVGFAARADMH